MKHLGKLQSNVTGLKCALKADLAPKVNKNKTIKKKKRLNFNDC